jgi:hypothetical protein
MMTPEGRTYPYGHGSEVAEHRVSSHLGLDVADYDTLIRRWIPAYDTMLDAIVSIVRTLKAPLVVDLGAGTAALSGAILSSAQPESRGFHELTGH